MGSARSWLALEMDLFRFKFPCRDTEEQRHPVEPRQVGQLAAGNIRVTTSDSDTSKEANQSAFVQVAPAVFFSTAFDDSPLKLPYSLLCTCHKCKSHMQICTATSSLPCM